MPRSTYIKLKIGDNEVNTSSFEELPITVSYSLEDSENFQDKQSSQSFDVNIPASLQNDKASNTFRNPGIEDLTSGEIFKSAQRAVLEENSIEILVGKAFLKNAIHANRPISYSYNILGDNADWLVPLTDKTIYDFINGIAFTFDKPTIEASWAYDGTAEALPYVFAPVRYRFPFGGYTTGDDNTSIPDDENVLPEYLKPALSKYWIMYWAFKSVGYKISSTFLDSEFFRRQVMPWTFSNFLDSGGTQLDAHKFLAKSVDDVYVEADRGNSVDEYVDMDVSNDSTLGAFDNNNDYTWNTGALEMTWTYGTPDFGPLNAAFSAMIFYEVSLSGNQSNTTVVVEWSVNGVKLQSDTVVTADSGVIGTQRPAGQTEVFFRTGDYGINVVVGDIVTAKVHVHLYRDKNGINDVAHVRLNVLQFQLDYFRIQLGGVIDFVNYTAFKDLNIIDYISGIIDEFDLSINTDPINKIVYLEPTHSYSLNNTLLQTNEGYFKTDFINWNGKEDFSKDWQLDNFSDVNKEFTFKYKDDSNDGILKLIQDRNNNILASGKYVFPDRFLTGAKSRENRFFSPTMHYSVTQWTALGTGDNIGITPQIVCIIPENVSNTSQSESENTFAPKSCYYKGNITGAGAWRFDGDVLQEYPFMFSVNYQDGGEGDPILSYSDENINGVVGFGLLKRFFWQRLAIMRNGQRYTKAFFKLNNFDIANILHREFISWGGYRWELIQIKDYKPLSDDSTEVLLYKWSPITERDNDNTFPSSTSLLGGTIGLTDIKYAQLKCLYSDIPT